jgi:SH3-like domain-containing protein
MMAPSFMCLTAPTKLALARALLGLATLMPLAAMAQGVEMRSVNVQGAVLYDSPSTKGGKLFLAPRGMPLEVISVVNQWVKVRDQAGDVLWIERSALSSLRTLVTTVTATVRAQADDTAPVVFTLERGALLDWQEPQQPAPAWLKVKHRDGSAGFVKASEVWGF